MILMWIWRVGQGQNEWIKTDDCPDPLKLVFVTQCGPFVTLQGSRTKSIFLITFLLEIVKLEEKSRDGILCLKAPARIRTWVAKDQLSHDVLYATGAN